MKQQQALDILMAGYNAFVTGPAGSGKTYVLNQFIKQLHAYGLEAAVTASTGIAATHLKGVTLHSWSGIGVRNKLTDWDIELLTQKEHLNRRYNKTDVLIVDEISMLHARQLEMVNYLAQAFRQDSRPFGGLQVVLCGDFFQLPPISRTGERQFAWESDTWQKLNLKMCYLSEQYRQHDQTLLQILYEIRDNKLSPDSLNILKSQITKNLPENIKPTKLYSHNVDVDKLNNKELDKLEGVSKIFQIRTRGRKNLIQVLLKSTPVQENLKLKKKAQVMFIKNDSRGRFVNGSRGVISKFTSDNLPVVKLLNKREVVAEPMDWNIEENGRALASITQIPLRLAWAITIHKSQGMSLDCAEIDLAQAFEPGMGYVALSRVRSLDGLNLLGFNNIALQVDKKNLEFDKIIKNQSEQVIKNLPELLKTPLRKLTKTRTAKPRQKLKNHEKTLALLNQGLNLDQIATSLSFTKGTVINHLEKLIQNNQSVNVTKFLPDKKTVEKIKKGFDKMDTDKLKPVYEYFKGVYDYDILRLVRIFLNSSENLEK